MAFSRTAWKRVISYILIVLSTILLVGLAFSLYVSKKLKPRISEELTALLSNATNQLYEVQFSEVQINLLTGTASLRDLEIKPNKKRYEQLVAMKLAPDNVYTLKLNQLQIRNFHLWRLYSDRVLHINRLIFKKPSIVMENRYFDFNKDRPPMPRISPYKFISKHISELKIGEISFQDVDLKYVDKNGEKERSESIDGLNIRGVNYLIDAKSFEDPSRMYLFKEINISVKDYVYTSEDRFYDVSVDKLNFTTNKGALELENVRLLPKYKELQFGRNAGYSRDRFEIAVDRISMEGLNLPNYIKNQEVHAKRMLIANGNIHVYSNNNLKRKVRNSLGKFPHQLLQKLPHLLTVEQTEVKDIDIKYSELDSESKEKGEIEFTNFEAQISNMTNHPQRKEKNKMMELKGRTFLMGEGKLDLEMQFDLKDKLGGFTYNGKLGVFNGKQLNRITKAMGLVMISRGNVQEMKFSVRANDVKAVGNMVFKYNDLAVRVLEVDEGQNKLVRKGWASFLVNNLMLDANNPMPGKALRVAPISYERNVEASFFSYLWRSLYSGIKYSVGVTPEREASLRKQINKFEEIKENREERRNVREKRIEERFLQSNN